MSETPEVTPVNEWTVPNQDKIEQVVDARLTKNSENETSEDAPAEAEPDTESNVDEAPESTEESDS